MSDAIDKTGCISHRPNTHFFVMYEDYLDVAKASEHQYKLAAFWRVLETKTNERKVYNEGLIEDCKKKGLPEPETNLWIEISYNEFAHRTLGVYKPTSFKIAAAESDRLGFSKSRVRKRPVNPLDPKSAKVDYKEYLFMVDAMQSVLNGGEYPTPVENDSTLLRSYNERKNKNTPVENDRGGVENDSTPVENDTPSLSKTTPTPVENDRLNNITNIDTKNNSIEYDVMAATASADVASTSHTLSLSEKKEAKEIPTTTPTTEQSVTPSTKKETAARRSPASRKNSRSKKNATADLLALSEIPAPQKPDPATHPYNVELFMMLADYYRGSELAESNNPNSNYQKALNAAMALVQRKAPFERVDKLFCFMLGRGEEIGLPKLRDQKWIDGGYHTDIWVVANHYTDKSLECQRVEQMLNGIAPNSKQSKSSGSSMSHDEAQEVARDAIEKGKQHGYSIKAQAVCEKGVWLVKIDWDGDPLTMRSPAEWEKTFNYNYEEDQKELALMKGAN